MATLGAEERRIPHKTSPQQCSRAGTSGISLQAPKEEASQMRCEGNVAHDRRQGICSPVNARRIDKSCAAVIEVSFSEILGTSNWVEPTAQNSLVGDLSHPGHHALLRYMRFVRQIPASLRGRIDR